MALVSRGFVTSGDEITEFLLKQNEDIDFAAEEIQVGRRTRVSAAGRVIEKPAKTEAGERTLPLWEPLLGELKAAKARQAAEKLRIGPAYHDLGYVMCNEAGEPYHPDTFSDMWAAVTKKAGVPHIRLHDARHTSATLMLMQGLDPATVSGWLGHADVAFTMRTYVHPQAEALKKGAHVLGEIMQSSQARAGGRFVTLCSMVTQSSARDGTKGNNSAGVRHSHSCVRAGRERARRDSNP